jgi:predicted metal-dependent hydrolase
MKEEAPTRQDRLTVRDVTVYVRRGGVKHLHLSVHPPAGEVRVSAPSGTSDDVIRRLVVSRLAWVRRRRAEQRATPRPPRREYTDGETFYLWGRAYRLRLVFSAGGRQGVRLEGDYAILSLRPNTKRAGRERAVRRFYREQLATAIPRIADRWEAQTGLAATQYRIKRMRTKWGSCNPARATVWLNLELAKHPPAALSYVLLHELLHLAEAGHTPEFRLLLDRYLPGWRGVRGELQRGVVPLPFPGRDK